MSSQNNTTVAILIQVNWYYSCRFWIAFGLTGLLLNIFEAVAIFHSKKHKGVFGLTLASLCVADILGSFCFLLAGSLRLHEYAGFFTITINENSPFASSWKAGHAALFFSVGISFAHIVFIAVQRFFAVFLPFRFKTFFTYKINAVVLSITWFLFLLSGVIGYFYSQGILQATYYLILAMGFILVITYSALCYKARRDFVRRKTLAPGSKSQTRTRKTTIGKTVSVSLAITLAFLCCTYLHPIYYLFVLEVEDLTFYHLVNSQISANPMLDAVIYFCFYYDCKREVHDLENNIASTPAFQHKFNRQEEILLQKVTLKNKVVTKPVPSMTI